MGIMDKLEIERLNKKNEEYKVYIADLLSEKSKAIDMSIVARGRYFRLREQALAFKAAICEALEESNNLGMDAFFDQIIYRVKQADERMKRIEELELKLAQERQKSGN